MNVFSFCLYGDKPKYIRGMHENIKIITEKFPEFLVIIYYGKNTQIEQYKHYHNVILIPGNYKDNQLMLDRFCPIDHPQVKVMFVRDADSRINERDEWCIREFLASPKLFHIIRDNLNHQIGILGGLWGMKQGCIPRFNMRRYVDTYVNIYNNKQGFDQYFLNEIIYLKIIDNALIHGSIKMSEKETPIPIPFKKEHIFCGQSIEYDINGAEYHNCNDCKAII
jgi:hypothetical protein